MITTHVHRRRARLLCCWCAFVLTCIAIGLPLTFEYEFRLTDEELVCEVTTSLERKLRCAGALCMSFGVTRTAERSVTRRRKHKPGIAQANTHSLVYYTMTLSTCNGVNVQTHNVATLKHTPVDSCVLHRESSRWQWPLLTAWLQIAACPTVRTCCVTYELVLVFFAPALRIGFRAIRVFIGTVERGGPNLTQRTPSSGIRMIDTYMYEVGRSVAV